MCTYIIISFDGSRLELYKQKQKRTNGKFLHADKNVLFWISFVSNKWGNLLTYSITTENSARNWLCRRVLPGKLTNPRAAFLALWQWYIYWRWYTFGSDSDTYRNYRNNTRATFDQTPDRTLTWIQLFDSH